MRRQQETESPGIDLNRAIGMAAAAQLMLGKGGRRGVAIDTARRWANPLRGCRVPGGETVVLATRRWCGELLTLPEWVEAFERARARHLAAPAACVATPRPARARKAAQRQAGQILDRMGVK